MGLIVGAVVWIGLTVAVCVHLSRMDRKVR